MVHPLKGSRKNQSIVGPWRGPILTGDGPAHQHGTRAGGLHLGEGGECALACGSFGLAKPGALCYNDGQVSG